MRTIFLLIAFSMLAQANDDFKQILEKTKTFESKNINLSTINDLNIIFENCATYPYYKANTKQTNGNKNLLHDFINGLKIANKCFLNTRSHQEIKRKYFQLLKIINNDNQKILKCEDKGNNSVFAVASVVPGHKKDWINNFFNLPKYPSIIFHTNTIAGNFPISMNQDDIREWRILWGQRHLQTPIAPGIRNPEYTKIENTKALVFHEMFHWPSNFHNGKKHLDIVKLSEYCCFESSKSNSHPEFKQAACNMLYDQQAWQKNQEKRLEYLNQNKFFQKFKKINMFFEE